jgi:TRAP-type C4-dicarboxylate transport system permease small subunit
MDPSAVIAVLRRANDAIAMAVGGLLLLTVGLILLEVTLRRLGLGALGGTDEVSGYAMAGATSWGMAYALCALAHVRIDLVRDRTAAPMRALLDLVSLGALTAVAAMVAWTGWGVLARSLQNASRANTPLETPLWIPQTLWWSGWVWFAVTAAILWLAAAALFLRGRHGAVEAAIGARDELDDALEDAP